MANRIVNAYWNNGIYINADLNILILQTGDMMFTTKRCGYSCRSSKKTITELWDTWVLMAAY